MNRGFYIILAAQFFSALGDNILLFAAIALLKAIQAPAWQTPVLQQFFVFAFIVFAPFMGPFSDALPKGRVMFISNSVKVVGCIAMLLGVHPLLAYGLVGVGAAMYSPAKYGILAEYLPSHELVPANGWMEGLTVGAIILGAVLGGTLISQGSELLGFDHFTVIGINSMPELTIALVFLMYLIAAIFNLYIPKLPIEHRLTRMNISYLFMDFWQSFLSLWKDPLGQVSLAVTSLFWGAGTTLRFIILSWAAVALNLDLGQATQLTAVVALGIALGSIVTAKTVRLERAVKVLPMGMLMGILVVMMVWVTDWRIAVIMLILIGAVAGGFVIPMNALLQYRGHQLMGSGHSIAVQNFNENIAILIMLGAYARMVDAAWSINTVVLVFGGFIFFSMALLNQRHGHDQD